MKTLEQIDLARREYGLTPARFHVLLTVMQHGPVSKTHLAKRVGVTGQAIGNMISVLKKKGWVEVKKSTADTRIVNVEPTSKANNIFKDA